VGDRRHAVAETEGEQHLGRRGDKGSDSHRRTRMARLSDEEIDERLAGLDGWERDGDAIRRQFELDDFKGSVDFVNRLTAEAEGMNHHPDLEISWNKVTVSITTHSEGGLTENDFELAARISRLA
jgi:4a-hydroxytetrahydrobiopterin dehydratase